MDATARSLRRDPGARRCERATRLRTLGERSRVSLWRQRRRRRAPRPLQPRGQTACERGRPRWTNSSGRLFRPAGAASGRNSHASPSGLSDCQVPRIRARFAPPIAAARRPDASPSASSGDTDRRGFDLRKVEARAVRGRDARVNRGRNLQTQRAIREGAPGNSPMAAPRPILVGFRVKYWTEWGQNLVVVGNHPKLGEWDVRKGVWMHCQVRARGHPSRSTADGTRSSPSAIPNPPPSPRRPLGSPPLRPPARR